MDELWTFIHFSHMPKLGINPRGGSGATPLGIYGWPESHLGDIPGSEGFQRRKYRIEFRVMESARENVWMVGDGPEGTCSDVHTRIAEALNYMTREDTVYAAMIRSWENVAGLSSQEMYMEFKDMFRFFPNRKPSISMTKVLRKARISGVVDWGTGSIFNSREAYQGVFFHTYDLNLLDIEDQERAEDGKAARALSSIRRMFRRLGTDLVDAEARVVDRVVGVHGILGSSSSDVGVSFFFSEKQPYDGQWSVSLSTSEKRLLGRGLQPLSAVAQALAVPLEDASISSALERMIIGSHHDDGALLGQLFAEHLRAYLGP